MAKNELVYHLDNIFKISMTIKEHIYKQLLQMKLVLEPDAFFFSDYYVILNQVAGYEKQMMKFRSANFKQCFVQATGISY